jgi:hypothetical protein
MPRVQVNIRVVLERTDNGKIVRGAWPETGAQVHIAVRLLFVHKVSHEVLKVADTARIKGFVLT